MAYVLLHSGQLSAKRLAKRLTDCTAAEELVSSASEDVVIRWGSQQGADRAAVFNSRRALQNVENRKQMLLMLQSSGIRTPLAAGATGEGNYRETRLRLTRHYRVPVVNMKVMSLFRSDGDTIWLDRRIG
ncbi:MAG: hypothetical protein JWN30_70, partial [Bacilli bacterium]|nr:hypothetical protein [Bacilli bacterium]